MTGKNGHTLWLSGEQLPKDNLADVFPHGEGLGARELRGHCPLHVFVDRQVAPLSCHLPE